jgi:hypothetical protein
LCGVASVLVFHHVARRLLRGVPLVLAVGTFAVSFYLIRHGNEVKQYSLDVLVSLGLIALSVEWLRRPDRTRWLWCLAALVPLAILASLPSVFIAGAVTLALAPGVWKRRERETWIAFVTYQVAMLASFGVIYVTFLAPNYAWGLANGVHVHYGDGFPPLGEAWGLMAWFARMHTGRMFAYPVGSTNGGSALTALCWLIGLVTIWRCGRRELFVLFTMPFVLGLIAGMLHKYPYGSNTRVMLYLAPLICLSAGLGAAAALNWLRPVRLQSLAPPICVALLAVVGSGMLVRDLVKPYKTAYDREARDFARWFWGELGRDGGLVCVLADLKTHIPDSSELRFPHPEYCCYQQMYSLRHRRGSVPQLNAESQAPLRCVLYRTIGEDHDPARFAAWLRRMEMDFELVSQQRFPVNATANAVYCREYNVYDFRPRGTGPISLARIMGSPDATRSR